MSKGEKTKELWKNPEYHKLMSEKHKGNKGFWTGKSFSDKYKKKLSEAHKGKKQSKETIHKRIKRGNEHWNWQGGKSFENYPKEFDKFLKQKIRERDGYCCYVCGKKEETLIGFHNKLIVHHIDYDKKNISIENLVSLCRSCHIKTNYNREKWILFFKYKHYGR